MGNRNDQYKVYRSGKLWITATVAVALFNASINIVSADDGKNIEQSSLVQNNKDVVDVSDNQTPLVVDDTEILNAVESAERVGVTVTQEPSRSKIVSDSEDITKVKNDIASDYAQQIAELQHATKTQQQNNQIFDQCTEDYETALYKGAQQNKDGKTQVATSAAKQALEFDTSKPADESSPTSNIEPSKICTGIGSHANLSDSTKVWEYEGPQVLNATIEKTWSGSGSIEDSDGNKRSVDFHEIFHDFQLQNGNWNDSNNYKESGIPHIAISSNAVDNVWATNLNWQTTFWFTYSDNHEVVPISKVPGSNEEAKVYFLSGSLSSTNFAGPEWDNWNGNRKEYVQTNDAKTAIINEQSTIGLDYISAEGIVDNAPGGFAYVNTSADFQSPNYDEDTNPQHYAIEEGVSFTDFTTDKPTLYIGAVPMNKNARWWHENHNMNSHELAFLKNPTKLDPVTAAYHLNTIMYEKNNSIQPTVAEIPDLVDEGHQENEESNETIAPENEQKGYGAATSPTTKDASVKNQSEVIVHYVLKQINGKELQATQTIKGASGESYYDKVGNFISNNSDGDVTTYEVPETLHQELAGITDSNDGLLHYTYIADCNGGVFTEKKGISNPKPNVWVIYTYSVDGKDGRDGQNGIDGKAGKDGRDGKDGKDGVDGQNGIDGKAGKDGRDGENGIDGKAGKDGRDGQNGIDGKAGENGRDGQNGIDGKAGKDGRDGQNGIDGKAGKDGRDGQNGIDGKAGKNGRDGQDGIDGKAGENGRDGENGIDGKAGKDGRDGQNGIDGKAGEDGRDGKDGIDGKAGKDGRDGKDGIDGKAGKDGRDGENGIDGKAGKDGRDGQNGIDGKAGKDGRDGQNGIDGKAGKDGQNGIDGKAGENGRDGQNGIDGKAGKDGRDGQNGIDGKAGKDGRDGQNGIDGKAGKDGRDGQNGIDGKAGKDGRDGQNGIDGKAGKDGRDGQNGIDGKAGENGRDGQNGIDGKAGKDGRDGQNGIDGKAGKDGRDGQNGIDGKAGKDGRDGQNGIDGKAGKDGRDGQNGIDGKAGKDGRDGQNGIDGKAGKNGRDGQNGIDGKAGKNGLDNQDVSSSIESEDISNRIDHENTRDSTRNFEKNNLSTVKTNSNVMEQVTVKDEYAPIGNDNQAQEKQVLAKDVSSVINQKLENYYHNSGESTFSSSQLKENNLAAAVEERISYHKNEQKQNTEKNQQTNALATKNHFNDTSNVNQTGDTLKTYKDIEKQKMKQSQNSLQLPKTATKQYSVSVLEVITLGMLLIFVKLHKRVRI